MKREEYKYLEKIDSPQDLKQLSEDELIEYCGEVRDFLISELSENPGHFGASVGAVELTAALHYIYDAPHDHIVWDVGHQAYAHKLITGRREQFHTNRKFEGISGFPSMKESPYDAFGAGHASVSISAAFGLAMASALKDEGRKVVAVIGDGAMTGGLAFEGLNNAGATNADMLVVLNDNRMSIDANVGALQEYFLKISSSKKYNKLKNRVWDKLEPTPRIRGWVKKTTDAVKQGVLQQSNLFESFGFRYFGPVDGHDVKLLTRTLRDLKEIKGPKLLHVITTKGKGYRPAEEDQSEWHAPGKFDKESGARVVSNGVHPPRYQEVFGHTLLELAQEQKDIVGITPAMPKGCSLNIMMEQMPNRCFDVGIAEGHAVTFSAGLAAGGLLPFCNIYSTFMQRAYDNVIHDVALQNLHVVFCLDRAGLVGEDGATHHGAYDIAYFRAVPNLVISSPINESELRNLMLTAAQTPSPFVIRYPRGRGEHIEWRTPMEAIPVGKAKVLREGSDIALLSFGPLGNVAANAAERAQKDGLSVLHADLRFAKPLDEELLHRVGREFQRVVTIEDGAVMGGVGSAVAEFFELHGYPTKMKMLGIPDKFIEHGTIDELHKLCQMDEESIYKALITSDTFRAAKVPK